MRNDKGKQPPKKKPTTNRPSAPTKPAAPTPTQPSNMQSDRLYLTPATLEMLQAAVNNRQRELESLLGGVYTEPGWSQFPDALRWMRDYIQAHPKEVGWWTYFIVHMQDARLIGTCGYKGMPTPAGIVEVGYEIAPRYQNQGLATEAVKTLVDTAFRQPTVKAATAHTKQIEDASTAVLRKVGFTRLGETFDLQDGPLWTWRLDKTTPIV